MDSFLELAFEDDDWDAGRVTQFDCIIDYPFVVNYFVGLFASSGAYHQFRVAIFYADSQLGCGKTPEHHWVNNTDAGTC